MLLRTVEEDLVMGAELDSVRHDAEKAFKRDELKHGLFNLQSCY